MSSCWSITDSRRRGVSVLKVLGIVFLVLVLICGGIITYVVRNARSMMVSAMRGPMVEMINETGLPEEQKGRLTDTVNKMMDDFESGAISMEQAGQITQNLFEGPFFQLIMVEMVRARHQDMIELEEKERAEVEMTFDRFERGVQEGKISEKKFKEAVDDISVEDEDGGQALDDDLSEEDLTAVVTAMKEAADEAEIPMENYQVDFADELQRVVDDVLGTELD